MGQSELNAASLQLHFADEAALKAAAGGAARAWQAESRDAILIGLRGDLGSGKTTWVRGMLEGLGYADRVPSPTYTLLEHYVLAGLDVVHVDLYRVGSASMAPADVTAELEALGLRDWLARERCWLLVEWPERAVELLRRCDVVIHFELGAGPEMREVDLTPFTARGASLLGALQQVPESSSS
jgi:tRNA threonylcarbamoyladenosine biosynthesis protein TsaE